MNNSIARRRPTRRLVFCLSALCVLSIGIIFIYARKIVPTLAFLSWRSDFAQDYIGARALLNAPDDLYPVLGPALAKLGLGWDLAHRSTHPPTNFLLVLPFALLDHQSALVLWMAAMLACIVLTARVLGLSWAKSALAGALSLAWPPTIWSLYQVTPIWMLGLALAYRFRRHSLASGIFVALASLPKFFAAPSLLYHFRRREWPALVGFGALWLGALALVLLLRSDAIAAYTTVNVGNSKEQIFRPDNGALLIVAWRLGGSIGLAVASALVLWVLWSGLRRQDAAGWACLVWLGIALLPIAWVYSLLPLLPWLVLALCVPSARTRILAGTALLLPYVAAVPTQRPWAVALAVALSGVALSTAPSWDAQEMVGHLPSTTVGSSVGLSTPTDGPAREQR